MAERTIKHVSFSYRIEVPDPIRPGETIISERKAARGDTVDIPFEDDVLRGEKFGAFETDLAPAEEVESVSALSDDELVAWIREDKPTVKEVVDSAEGDPELARRLLDAEDKAHDGESRRGVLESLTAIVGRGQ